MLRSMVEAKQPITAITAAVIGLWLSFHFGFEAGNPLLGLIAERSPWMYGFLRASWTVFLFSTPAFLIWTAIGQTEMLVLAGEIKDDGNGKLPPYPAADTRDELFLIIGEKHHPKKAGPVRKPEWVKMPRSGLFCGIKILGAIGSGKTSAAMKPFVDQLFGYKASDPEKKIGGLVLEVKGDFCKGVKQTLTKWGRADDYVEMSLDGDYQTNPLHNEADAYSLAYSISSLQNQLFGKGKEPFWPAASTNVIQWVITLHRILCGYVTFEDIYHCVINPDLLKARIADAEKIYGSAQKCGMYIRLDPAVYGDEVIHGRMEAYNFVRDENSGQMEVAFDPRIAFVLTKLTEQHGLKKHEVIDYGEPPADGPRPGESEEQADRRQQFREVARWYKDDWMRMDEKLRTSIVEGISVFFSMFAANPKVQRKFCPRKEAYDPEANRPDENGKYPFGRTLPSFEWLVENGKVLAVNFPSGLNAGLAKALGTLIKLDFQTEMKRRITRIEKDPNRYWREVVFICDEYQYFATVGEDDPSGDEKFLSVSRQPRLIPIVATQSVSSLRSALPRKEACDTLLQTFRSTIFLTLSDPESTKWAEELVGQEYRPTVKYSLTEQANHAKVSRLSGRTVGEEHTVVTTKNFETRLDPRFRAKEFGELLVYQGILSMFDGVDQHEAVRVYLKPAHRPAELTWFEQSARGMHP